MSATLRLRGARPALLLGLAALVAGAFGGRPAAAQELPAAPGCRDVEVESEVFTVRFKSLEDAITLVDRMMGPCGSYRVPKSLQVLAVEDEPETLRRIAEALSSWDVPPPTVEVSISLVMATRNAPPKTGLRKELEDVSETLSRVTRWTSYERIGSATLRIPEGGQALADMGDRYQVSFRVQGVDTGQGVIHLEPFDLMRLPLPREAASGVRSPRLLLANSALNVLEGRLNLVGAASRSPERALFVAIEAWVAKPRVAQRAQALEEE